MTRHFHPYPEKDASGYDLDGAWLSPDGRDPIDPQAEYAERVVYIAGRKLRVGKDGIVEGTRVSALAVLGLSAVAIAAVVAFALALA